MSSAFPTRIFFDWNTSKIKCHLMNSSIRLTKMHRFRTLTFLDSKSRRPIFSEFSLEKQLTSSIICEIWNQWTKSYTTCRGWSRRYKRVTRPATNNITAIMSTEKFILKGFLASAGFETSVAGGKPSILGSFSPSETRSFGGVSGRDSPSPPPRDSSSVFARISLTRAGSAGTSSEAATTGIAVLAFLVLFPFPIFCWRTVCQLRQHLGWYGIGVNILPSFLRPPSTPTRWEFLPPCNCMSTGTATHGSGRRLYRLGKPGARSICTWWMSG